MYCPKCGSELPDGSKFCSTCGERLSEEAQKVEASAGVAAETESPVSPAAETAPKEKKFAKIWKKIGGKKFIGVAVAVVIVVAAIIGVRAIVSNRSGGNAYVYLSDGSYELLTSLGEDQAIEIASSKSDISTDSLLSFSPSGEYVYYFTKVDINSGTGSLCRAEYDRLKKDSNKNEKYIETIASNVLLGFRFINGDAVLYENGDDTLYYFDGKEAVQVAKNVNEYYTADESNQIVYTSADDSEGYTLYGITLDDISNKVKLAGNVSYVYDASDFNNILYVRNEDSYEDSDEGSLDKDSKGYSLYVVGFSKEAEKLAEGIGNLTKLGEKTYFTANNGEKLSLYDFVDDAHAEEDAGIKEPAREDFSVPEYSYEMISGSDLSESDFDELYTSCTRDLYWYGASTFFCYSMEDALNLEWGEDGKNTEAIHTATQSFIDKFGNTADEDGYILVTDEVKAALKEINKYGENPEDEWGWLWFCYNKYQSGSTTDYDAYSEALDQWNEAEDRISMREELQDEGNDYDVSTLYCFDNGNLTSVNETVLDAISYDGGIMFNTTDMISETVQLENLYSVDDVYGLFSIDEEAENYIALADGTVVRMSASAAESFSTAYYDSFAKLYFRNGEVFLGEGDGALSVATISGGAVGDFSAVTDDADIVSFDEDTLYYASGYYDNNGVTYCDLYSYNKNGNARIARDVMAEYVNLYDDGAMLAYTGYQNRYGYELTMFDSEGKPTLIGEDISQYVRIDKSTLLYVSDGELYSFNGKEKQLIASDVDRIWSKNSMGVARTLGNEAGGYYNDYYGDYDDYYGDYDDYSDYDDYYGDYDDYNGY